MKCLKKSISVLLTLLMVLSMSVTTFASAGGPPDDAGAMEAGMAQPGGGGGGGGPMMGGAPDTGAIVITDGAEDSAAEYAGGAYADKITSDKGTVTIKGLDLTNGDYTFNGIVAKGEDTTVRIEDCKIYFSVDTPCASGDAGGSATAIGKGGKMFISGSDLKVDGAGRYVTSAYDSSTLVVNDSTITSTGNNANTDEIAAPRSNGALLISGTARANFSIGATQTYYYNSSCIAEGWAALSTDSATGPGLDLYAYGTKGIAQNGGYGTYADTNCRVWLYGSDLEAAEIGAIISKTGQIVTGNGADAGADILQYNEGATNSDATVIAGGRNAVMMHAPDMMGSGKGAASTAVLTMKDSVLRTTTELKTTEDYYAKYGQGIGAYVDYVSGADLLVRSTSATITLDNVTMESYSGVLLLTALNADSMGNFLKEEDGAEVDPIAIAMNNMEATGDILHMDYQRRMVVELNDTSLNGDIVSGEFADWNSMWSSYGEEASNWMPDESWNTFYGAAVTLNGSAVWTPDEISSVSSLTVNDNATVNGHVYVAGKEVTVTPGETYSGKVIVSAGELTKEELKAQGCSAGMNLTFIIILVVILLAIAVIAGFATKKKKSIE